MMCIHVLIDMMYGLMAGNILPFHTSMYVSRDMYIDMCTEMCINMRMNRFVPVITLSCATMDASWFRTCVQTCV